MSNLYYKVMKEIEKRIDTYNERSSYSTKEAKSTSSSLMARASIPTGVQFEPEKGRKDTITDEIAGYINSIRKQKEEIISGKK